MSALTKNELVKLNAELGEQLAAARAEISTLRTQLEAKAAQPAQAPATPKPVKSKTYDTFELLKAAAIAAGAWAKQANCKVWTSGLTLYIQPK